MDNFITEIVINHSRNLNDFIIPLSKEKRQHLILTGKNGSGKTSLIQEVNKFLSQAENSLFKHYEMYKEVISNNELHLKKTEHPDKRFQLENTIKSNQTVLDRFGGVELKFSTSLLSIDKLFDQGKFLMASFNAIRNTNSIVAPNSIRKLNFGERHGLNHRVNKDFIQFLVNLKAESAFAREDNDIETVTRINSWFNDIENRLGKIFDVSSFKLKFDRQNFNYNVETDDIGTFTFNTLSSGYSAILSIVSEILLRMEAVNCKAYDAEGVVIIDEIETHLHVDLQKKILPFLTEFFPNIQFIISTHSPFVLSSISNAVIFDLESKSITSDLSSYPYDMLVESYFNSGKFSDLVIDKLKYYEELLNRTEVSISEHMELLHLRDYFENIPGYLTKELQIKLQELEHLSVEKRIIE